MFSLLSAHCERALCYITLGYPKNDDILLKEGYTLKNGCSHLKKHLEEILKKKLKPKY